MIPDVVDVSAFIGRVLLVLGGVVGLVLGGWLATRGLGVGAREVWDWLVLVIGGGAAGGSGPPGGSGGKPLPEGDGEVPVGGRGGAGAGKAK